MRERKFRRPEAGGFTLIEVLIGVVLLGLIAIAIAAISLPGVLRISTDSQERQVDATTAQWSSLVFARDVQGASELGAECASGEGGTRLLTLIASDGASPDVEYRVTGADPYELVRAECGVGSREVVRDLEEEPTVDCRDSADDPVDCLLAGASPRVVKLQVESRTDRFEFELDGVRRTTGGDGIDGPDPDPFEVPDFVALGGDKPLSIGGSSQLIVEGNAYINAPDSGNTAVFFNGGATLTVTGDFRLQTGAECQNGCANANKAPGLFPVRIPDPLRFLPPPDASGLTVQTDCPVQSIDGQDRRVCQPGVYEVEFPPSGGGVGGVKDFVLADGTYVLRDGLQMTNGSISGDEVLIYNDGDAVSGGAIRIQGGDFDLGAPSSGLYAGILVFQARTNLRDITINANATIASLSGTIYAPGCVEEVVCDNGVEVQLGSGTADMTVGRIIGAGLSTSGTGKVTVVGG